MTDEDIRIEFINDGVDEFGNDRNLQINGISIDGRAHAATPSTVQTSATFEFNRLIAYENGFVQFGVNDPGSVSLLTSSFVIITPTVSAEDGAFSAYISRSGDRDGDIELRWTATPIDGFPLAQTSGTVQIFDGQGRIDFEVPFVNNFTTGQFELRIESLSPEVEVTRDSAIVNVV